MAVRSGDLPGGKWGGGRDKIALQLGYAPENSLRALVNVETRWLKEVAIYQVASGVAGAIR